MTALDDARRWTDAELEALERSMSRAIVELLALQGIEDIPVFSRNRISNQKEQVEMLVQEAAWLDEGTILRKLPNLTPDEAQAVLIAREDEDMARMGVTGGGDDEGESPFGRL